MRQWLAAEDGFGRPGAEIDGEGHAVAGKRADNRGIRKAGMRAKDRLPVVGKEHGAAPPVSEFDAAQSGMQAADAPLDAGD